MVIYSFLEKVYKIEKEILKPTITLITQKTQQLKIVNLVFYEYMLVFLAKFNKLHIMEEKKTKNTKNIGY
jgi:hypothetical protein